MIAILLRIACITVLSAVLVASITGIVVLLRPSKSVQVRKFVVSGSDTQKDQAAIISQMVAVRIQQIDSVLTTDLTSDAPPEPVIFESVLKRELRLTPEVGDRLEVEFKAFELDVAGILNSILDALHKGPILRGVVLNKDKEVEIVSNYREEDTDVLGPWVVRSREGTGEAIEMLAHRIVLDFHRKQTRQFGNMSLDQFRLFVSSLKDYQEYVHQIASDKVASRLPQSNFNLLHAKEGLNKLVEQKVDCSRVYSYLGSVSTILKDENSARESFSAALALDPTDEFSKKALGSTNVTLALKQPPPENPGSLDTVFQQPAFQYLKIGNDIQRHAITPIVVAVLADGVAPLSGVTLVRDAGLLSPSAPGIEGPHVSAPGIEGPHGTQVASIIAAIAPSARILPVRVLGEDTTGDTVSVLEGIVYARTRGARVFVLPFGMRERSEALAEAVKGVRDAGGLVVAPAGNESSSLEFYPAAFSTVLSVAALDTKGVLAKFSNYGKWVKTSAPGVGILTLDPSGRTQKMDGTSASCAEAAGIAALVWSVRPQLTGEKVAQILLETAGQPVGPQTAAGPLNATAAVLKAGTI
jgi:hypothetical protein